jgi:hypothetical protein
MGRTIELQQQCTLNIGSLCEPVAPCGIEVCSHYLEQLRYASCARLPHGPLAAPMMSHGHNLALPLPLGALCSRRRQNLYHPAGFSAQAFVSRSCRGQEGRNDAAPPATQVDREIRLYGGNGVVYQASCFVLPRLQVQQMSHPRQAAQHLSSPSAREGQPGPWPTTSCVDPGRRGHDPQAD